MISSISWAIIIKKPYLEKQNGNYDDEIRPIVTIVT